MEIGKIKQVDIDREMRTAYLDYAMSVIASRALPDARDGLKPVHRRILYGMHDMGIRAGSSYKKSARIVGDVLGKYHPHGDMAVYEAMARLAQTFSLRYPLVDGQGNFGSVDGDAPAAMRYTEARLSPMAEEMLTDIEKETVNFADNFDNTLQEPTVMPSRLPNLLLNGASGIAVGMATNIPPHNLRELCAALAHLIDHYDTIEDVTIEELMQHLPGPDFPTGGMIIGGDGIRQAYSTGRGRLVVRGVAHTDEEGKGGRQRIIITEIPYQVNKSSFIERIADLVHDEKISDIADLRDESDRTGMSIVIELKRGAQPKKVLNQLYKFTPLQSTFGVQMLALVNGEPRLLPLKRSLMLYIEHRQEVITRRSRFDLEKARRRAHILDGLLIALSNLDEVIRTIRESPDAETAKTQLIKNFKLSEVQAQAILDMQLRRLAGLERKKIEDEHRTILQLIANLEDLLANPGKILEVIKTDLNDIVQKYGDKRRTQIAAEAQEELTEKDLVADEEVLVSLTQRGYIKRTALKTYRTQGRGQVGVSGQTLRGEDEVILLIPARSLETLLFFSDRGKVYSQKAYQIPDAGRTEKGIPASNVLSLADGERISAAVSVPDFNLSSYIVLATARGHVKRMPLAEFESVRQSGILAIKVAVGDTLGWARLTSGNDDILLVTANGRAVRFPESGLRPQGRNASGVRGIRFKGDDRVASMSVAEAGGSLLVVTERGYGKRSLLEEYSTARRGGSGVKTISQAAQAKIGKIAAARVVQDSDEVTLISTTGIVLRLKVKDISCTARSTRGVRLMNLSKGGTVAALARLAVAETKEEGLAAVETQEELVAAETQEEELAAAETQEEE